MQIRWPFEIELKDRNTIVQYTSFILSKKEKFPPIDKTAPN